MDPFQEDTVLVDAALNCEACGRVVATLLPASDGRSVCVGCCQTSESQRDTATWNGVNPLDPLFEEDTLPVGGAADLHVRVQARLKS